MPITFIGRILCARLANRWLWPSAWISLAISLLATVAAASPFDLFSDDWEGCAQLVNLARNEVGQARVVPSLELDYQDLKPQDAIILLHPMGAYDFEELAAFMREGGRVAVLDDFGDGDRLLERFHIERTSAPARPLNMLANNPQLPLAARGTQHPLVYNVTSVALNHPTTFARSALSPILRIPLEGGDEGPAVAVAGQIGEGRLVAVGDPSIFINSMIRFRGNTEFAKNLATYLLDRPSESGGKLYIVSNHFSEHGSLSGFGGSWREALRDLRNALESIHKNGFPPAISRTLALLAMVLVGLWLLVRVGQKHPISMPRFAHGSTDDVASDDNLIHPADAAQVIEAIDNFEAGSREASFEGQLSAVEAKLLGKLVAKLRWASDVGKTVQTTVAERALLAKVANAIHRKN